MSRLVLSRPTAPTQRTGPVRPTVQTRQHVQQRAMLDRATQERKTTSALRAATQRTSPSTVVARAIQTAAKVKRTAETASAQRGVARKAKEIAFRESMAKAKTEALAVRQEAIRANVLKLAVDDLAYQRSVNPAFVPGNRPGDGLQSATITSSLSPSKIAVPTASLNPPSAIPTSNRSKAAAKAAMPASASASSTPVDVSGKSLMSWAYIFVAGYVGWRLLKKQGAQSV